MKPIDAQRATAEALAELEQAAAAPRAPASRIRPLPVLLWAVAIACLVWAGMAGYRVLKHREGPTAQPAEEPPRTLPASTGEYPHEKARALLSAGRELLRAGDGKSGLEAVEQVVRFYPESPQARQALLTAASTYRYQNRQPNKALELYTKFVQDYPDDREMPRVIGYIRDLARSLNLPDPSATLLRAAIAQTAGQPEVAARLQQLLDRNGR